MPKHLLFFWLILILVINDLKAQTGDWTHFQLSVIGYSNFIVEDQNGNLWLNGYNGLLKYDGIQFTEYTPSNSGLPYPSITDFCIGPDGAIWMLVYEWQNTGWLTKFDNGNWTNYDLDVLGLSNNRPSALSVEVNGDVLVAMNSGQGMWRFDGNVWENLNFLEPGISERYGSIHARTDGSIWAITKGSICFDVPCFFPANVVHISASDTTLYSANDGAEVPNALTTYIHFPPNGLPLTAGGAFPDGFAEVSAFNGVVWEYQSILNDTIGFINDFFVDDQNRVWLGSGSVSGGLPGGLSLYENGSWNLFNSQNSGLLQDYINQVYIKDDGTIWVLGEEVLSSHPSFQFEVNGAVIFDADNTGSLTPGDGGIPYPIVEVLPGPFHVMGNEGGSFSGRLIDEGNYSVSYPQLPPFWTYTFPLPAEYNFFLNGANPVSSGNNFGIYLPPGSENISISMSNFVNPRPGGITCINLFLNNYGAVSSTGSITVAFDPILSFQYADLPPLQVNPNEVIFDYNDFGIFDQMEVSVCFSVPADGSLIGQELSYSVYAAPNGSDIDNSNNSDTLVQEIVGAIDPNIKSVEPKGSGENGNIPPDTELLTYTIQFQNTGTDTAFLVIIADKIDPNLDLATFQCLGASHDYSMELLQDRTIKWTFENILLPDSTTNEIESHGTIQYTIKTKQGLPVGTHFENYADIYFDYNEPIRTNTVINTLFDPATEVSQLFEESDCNLYYHNKLLFIQNCNQHVRSDIQVFDVTGRSLISRHGVTPDNPLDIGFLPAGVYFAYRKDPKGGKAIKFIVN